MQIMKLKKWMPKALMVLLSLVMIGGFLPVSPLKHLGVTDVEAGRGTARGVGGGAAGSGPGPGGGPARGGGAGGSRPGYGAGGVGGPGVAARPRGYVRPGPGGPGPRAPLIRVTLITIHSVINNRT
jgi:hypothetical protein